MMDDRPQLRINEMNVCYEELRRKKSKLANFRLVIATNITQLQLLLLILLILVR